VSVGRYRSDKPNRLLLSVHKLEMKREMLDEGGDVWGEKARGGQRSGQLH
jgi:hypothetical protein